MSSTTQPVGLPSSFGRRAAPALVPLLIVPLTAILVLRFNFPLNWFQVALYLIVAAAILLSAWLKRARPPLLVDAEGLRDPKGTLLLRWDQAALIWISDDSPRWVPRPMRSFSLRAWEASALDYARRTGFQATPRLLKPWIPTTLTAPDLVDLIRGFSPVDVREGSGRDLRRLIHQPPGAATK